MQPTQSRTRRRTPQLALLMLASVLSGTASAQQVRYVPEDHPSIAAALNASSSGDVIRVSPGIYNEHDLAPPSLTTVTIESVLGPEVTVIDSQGLGRILDLRDVAVELAGLTLRGGRAATGTAGFDGAHGSFDDVTELTSPGGAGSSGSAGADGGAIYVESAELVARSCIFEDNHAGVGGPGGVGGDGFNGDTSGAFGIKPPTDGGNGGTGGPGGAIAVGTVGEVVVIQCIFRNNRAGRGGSGGLGGFGGEAIENVLGCEDATDGGDGGNGGRGEDGGAIAAFGLLATADVQQCVFDDNRAGTAGSPSPGGLGGNGGGGVFCTIEPGASGATGIPGASGAGRTAWAGFSSTVRVNGCTILPFQQTGQFVGNVAATFSNYTPTSTPDPADKIVVGDPLLIDPAAGDYRPTAASPLIDAGDSLTMAALDPALIGLDFDRNSRFVDDPATADSGTLGPSGEPVIDIGAFEFGAGLPYVPPSVFVSFLGSPAASGGFDDPLDTVQAGLGSARGGTVAVVGGTYDQPGTTTLDAPGTLVSSGKDVRLE